MATKKSTALASAKANEAPSSERIPVDSGSEQESGAASPAEAAQDASRGVLGPFELSEQGQRLLREGQAEMKSLQRGRKRIDKEMARRGIAPGSPEAERMHSRFLRHGTEVNVALLRAAIFEGKHPEKVLELIVSLNDSFPHRRLVDEWILIQDEGSAPDTQFGINNYLQLRMHARIYIAGMIAGREIERKKRHRRSGR